MHGSLSVLPQIIRRATKCLTPQRSLVRTFLSQAYYCDEVWEHRLNSPILKKVNVDDLYFELDQRYQKTRQMSAVDADTLANAVDDEEHVNELLDAVHKLRLTADSSNTLDSTSHAVVRFLTRCGKKDDLLLMLDDRINYGIFLDFYTANILMDAFWKAKDFTSGAKVASQLMLQEDFDHPISLHFSLLHCYQYLTQPGEWLLPPTPEEPEEEVKVRVKFIRNPYDDEHFDLRDPNRIVGKTLAMFTSKQKDPVSKSLNLLGWILFNKLDKAKDTLKECQEQNTPLCKDILSLIPDENEMKPEVASLATDPTNIEQVLTERVNKAVQNTSEKDIANQCSVFSKWEEQRNEALQEQIRKLTVAKRLSNIEDIKQGITEKETKLWFFENQEKIELDIESTELKTPQEEKTKKSKSKKDDQDYIPPEMPTPQFK